jgi:hypothetical protein
MDVFDCAEFFDLAAQTAQASPRENRHAVGF